MPHFCYILHNDKNNKTYNGYTNNLERRLRQHNMEIKGGAKYTTREVVKNAVTWRYLCVVTSPSEDFTKQKALSLEWHIKYPDNKRSRSKHFNSPEGRIRGMELALQNEKFTGIDFDVVKYCYDNV